MGWRCMVCGAPWACMVCALAVHGGAWCAQQAFSRCRVGVMGWRCMAVHGVRWCAPRGRACALHLVDQHVRDADQMRVVLEHAQQHAGGAEEERGGRALPTLAADRVPGGWSDAAKTSTWADSGWRVTVSRRGLRCWASPHECGGQPQAFRCRRMSPWRPAMASPRRPLWPSWRTPPPPQVPPRARRAPPPRARPRRSPRSAAAACR